MSDTHELVERYTAFWNTNDIEGFLSMVSDGCMRHDPGRSAPISLADNEQRFRRAHEELPGLTFTNAWSWEHGPDVITVAYTMRSGEKEFAGLEVFRFEGGRIVEVWNAPPGHGPWSGTGR